jgi:hypothetical protein
MIESSLDAPFEVVLKLFGKVSAAERALSDSYSRLLGDRYSILYDLGGAANRSSLPSSLRDSLPQGNRICFYSFSAVKERFTMLEWRFYNMSRVKSSMVSHFMQSRNLMVEPPLVLLHKGLLEGCDALPVARRPRFRWALEADAAFPGDVLSFFNSFLHDHSDLLSTGFTIADERW